MSGPLRACLMSTDAPAIDLNDASRRLQAAEITRQNTVAELAGGMRARLRAGGQPEYDLAPRIAPQIIRWPAPMRTGNILSLRFGTFLQLARSCVVYDG